MLEIKSKFWKLSTLYAHDRSISTLSENSKDLYFLATFFKYKLLLMSYDWEERAFPSIVNKYFDHKNDMHLDQLDQEFGDRE